MTEESFNLPEWNEAVGQMIAHLDDAALPRILINAIRGLVPIDKSLITLEKKQQIPVHLFDSGIDPEEHELHEQLEMAYENFDKSILTKREPELTRLMLRGHSVKSAAWEMRISPDTIKMHRKNLYAKLNI
jgi:DNA-binding CsgD family transcriptional regulator